ncbi:MAG: hypothetical protein ACLPQS_17615 [Acidimicrobiales bacterium]
MEVMRLLARRSVLVVAIGGLSLLAVALAGCSTPVAAPRTTSLPATSPASTTTSSKPPSLSSSLASFLRLAERGAGGTFSATYRVVGDASPFGVGTGLVTVAQRAAAGHTPFLDGIGQDSVGEWSYRLSFSSGSEYQWIENGGTAEDCWGTRRAQSACYGPSLFEPSNGFFIAIAPYLPGGALQSIKEIADRGLPYGSNHTTTFKEPGNEATGPLMCLRDRTSDGIGTWCLTRSGFFAGFDGSGNVGSMGFSPVSLVSKATTAPEDDFQPVGRLKSGFELPPEG